MLSRLTIFWWPTLKAGFKCVIEFHQTKLTTKDILFEAAVMMTFLFYLLFRKKLFSWYNSWQVKLKQKSVFIATAAPFLLYGIILLLTARFGKKFILPFTDPWVLPLFGNLLPLVRLFWTLKTGRVTRYSEELIVWIVLATIFATSEGLSFIPFSRRIANYIPLLREVMLLIYVSLLISPWFSKVAYDAVYPLIQYFISKVPALQTFLNVSSLIPVESLALALKWCRIPDVYIDIARSTVEDSASVIIFAVSAFVPFGISIYGLLLVSLVLPAYKCSNFITLQVVPNSSTLSLETQKVLLKWLQYWLWVGLVWLFRAYRITLYSWLIMLFSLFLQNSYFKGGNWMCRLVWLNYQPAVPVAAAAVPVPVPVAHLHEE